MITEDYVSYEVAKLLKEKGFDEYCDNYYDQSSDEPQQLTLDEMYYSYDEFLKAPTHQMAMKWLRTKGIYIYIQSTKYVGGALYGFQAIVEDGRNSAWKKSIHHAEDYEQAVEAALKYSLENLI